MSQPTQTTGRQQAQKRNRETPAVTPPPAANAPRLRQRATPEIIAQAEQATKYAEARKFLETNCILATATPCNPYTLTNALLILASTFRMPTNVAKAINHLSEISMRIDMHCDGCTKALTFPKLLEDLRVGIQMDMEEKLEQLGQNLADKQSDHEDIGKVTDKLEEAAKGLTEAAAGIEAKINKVSDTTSQLANTANTYKDALLKVPSRRTMQAEAPQLEEAIERSTDRKQRQVLIELSLENLNAFSLEDIKNKAMEAIRKVVSPSPPGNIAILEVTKTRRNGLI